MGLSTHILDTNLGRPAANVAITLEEFRETAWHLIGSAFTDGDGRCKSLLGDHAFVAADYRLHFDVGSYFRDLGQPSLYPYVEIIFRITDPAQHYHIPLLLTANGYTTYRGS
ncbi:MAG TPA: hydroxyisourate hydrolase [Acidobacteriaceae bacterium]|jgi:5-hydroxyisourate hydrolase